MNEPPWMANNIDNNYTLAVTGATLSYFDNKAKIDKTDLTSLNMILEKCRIFARMSPEHKSLLVGLL